MEENNNSTIIKMAIGVIVTLMVVGVVIALFTKVLPSIDHASKKIDNTTVQMDTLEYKNYDGTVVSGSEVLSAINTKASADITITVKTLGGTKTYNSSSYNTTSVSDVNYIEPTGKFAAVVVRNANKAVSGITFTQQ